jgi:AcrR family transcriptional regulator
MPTAPKPRAGETRRRLLEQGAAAFARKGLAAVNLKRDILEPAGVSVGSFYHQFKDKSDLLVAILEQHAEAQRARFREVHRPDGARSGEEIARASYALVFDLADQHPHAMQIQLRERQESDPHIREFIERDRQRWQRSLTDDYQRIAEARGFEFEGELAAELIAALTHGVLEHYLAMPSADRPKARERLIDGLVRLTLRGLPGLVPAEAAKPTE